MSKAVGAQSVTCGKEHAHVHGREACRSRLAQSPGECIIVAQQGATPGGHPWRAKGCPMPVVCRLQTGCAGKS